MHRVIYLEETGVVRRAWRRPERIGRCVGASAALREKWNQFGRWRLPDGTSRIEGETVWQRCYRTRLSLPQQRCNRPFIKLNCAQIPLALLGGALWSRTGRFHRRRHAEVGPLRGGERARLFLMRVAIFPRIAGKAGCGVARTGVSAPVQYATPPRRVAWWRRRTGPFAWVPEAFRHGSLFRRNVFPIALPTPARRRAEDISALVSHFVHKYSNRMSNRSRRNNGRDGHSDAQPWPGTFEALQNFIGVR